MGLWNSARKVDDVVNSLNSLGIKTGYDYGMLYYLAVIVLVVQGVILLMAYKPLKEVSKKGWDLMLLSVLVSFAFSLLYLFTDVGTFGNFLLSLIGTTIGLYILAQVRSHYKGVKAVAEKVVKKAEAKK